MSETGPVRRLASLTTEEAAGVLREGTALLLPVGSTEAHGPHLPLDDRIAHGVGLFAGESAGGGTQGDA